MTDGFRSIVVGVDLGAHGEALSEGSEHALSQARLVAERFGASLRFVHSTRDDEHWEDDRGEFVRKEPLADGGRAVLHDVVESLRVAGIDASLELSDDHPAVAIADAVGRAGAELAIVGKRTSRSRDGRRLGSIARAVIHDCPSAVWVVHPEAGIRPALILAAVDLSLVGERVVVHAAAVAEAFGAELHLVHAQQLPISVQLGRDADEAKWLQKGKSDAEEQLRDWLDGASAQLHVGLTSPSQAVLSGEKQLEPDLVVMGTVSRGGAPRLILGNTAERLLSRLDTSLLVIKPASPSPATPGPR